ncbi:MAG: hypothetical protein A7315_03640 [Candidatus Altiarchaeales archaeon WOR_SM1_79]|nr:MAG: hypothetical protein A7315_03640 [Candidatus Altiarchaeales archaeon WOR_SM1_79]
MKEIILKYNPWWHTKEVPKDVVGIKRSRYLNQILPFIDSPEVIKIVGYAGQGKPRSCFR